MSQKTLVEKYGRLTECSVLYLLEADVSYKCGNKSYKIPQMWLAGRVRTLEKDGLKGKEAYHAACEDWVEQEKMANEEAEAPKQPTEVDRLKNKQKQQDIQLKHQQSDELLAAQERELQKTTREKLAKASEPKKSA